MHALRPCPIICAHERRPRTVRGRRRGRTSVAGGAAAARDRARRAPSGRAVARGGRACVGGGVGPRRASVNAAWLAVSGSDASGERAERAELAEGRSE